MVKFVFLDLDNTLLDFNKSESNALKEAFAEMNVYADDSIAEMYSKINSDMWKLLEKKKITRDELTVKRFAILFAKLNVNADPFEAHRRYASKLSKQVFFIDGAIDLLENLQGKYKLYAATNGNAEIQHGRIERSGIGKYFDKIFISQEVGFNKPDREFFEGCFKQIENFDRKKAVILGDSLSSDITGGKNAGIYTCLYSPHNTEIKDVIPDRIITSLAQFEECLNDLSQY